MPLLKTVLLVLKIIAHHEFYIYTGVAKQGLPGHKKNCICLSQKRQRQRRGNVPHYKSIIIEVFNDEIFFSLSINCLQYVKIMSQYTCDGQCRDRVNFQDERMKTRKLNILFLA